MANWGGIDIICGVGTIVVIAIAIFMVAHPSGCDDDYDWDDICDDIMENGGQVEFGDSGDPFTYTFDVTLDTTLYCIGYQHITTDLHYSNGMLIWHEQTWYKVSVGGELHLESVTERILPTDKILYMNVWQKT